MKIEFGPAFDSYTVSNDLIGLDSACIQFADISAVRFESECTLRGKRRSPAYGCSWRKERCARAPIADCNCARNDPTSAQRSSIHLHRPCSRRVDDNELPI